METVSIPPTPWFNYNAKCEGIVIDVTQRMNGHSHATVLKIPYEVWLELLDPASKLHVNGEITPLIQQFEREIVDVVLPTYNQLAYYVMYEKTDGFGIAQKSQGGKPVRCMHVFTFHVDWPKLVHLSRFKHVCRIFAHVTWLMEKIESFQDRIAYFRQNNMALLSIIDTFKRSCDDDISPSQMISLGETVQKAMNISEDAKRMFNFSSLNDFLLQRALGFELYTQVKNTLPTFFARCMINKESIMPQVFFISMTEPMFNRCIIDPKKEFARCLQPDAYITPDSLATTLSEEKVVALAFAFAQYVRRCAYYGMCSVSIRSMLASADVCSGAHAGDRTFASIETNLQHLPHSERTSVMRALKVMTGEASCNSVVFSESGYVALSFIQEEASRLAEKLRPFFNFDGADHNGVTQERFFDDADNNMPACLSNEKLEEDKSLLVRVAHARSFLCNDVMDAIEFRRFPCELFVGFYILHPPVKLIVSLVHLYGQHYAHQQFAPSVLFLDASIKALRGRCRFTSAHFVKYSLTAKQCASVKLVIILDAQNLTYQSMLSILEVCRNVKKIMLFGDAVSTPDVLHADSMIYSAQVPMVGNMLQACYAIGAPLVKVFAHEPNQSTIASILHAQIFKNSWSDELPVRMIEPSEIRAWIHDTCFSKHAESDTMFFATATHANPENLSCKILDDFRENCAEMLRDFQRNDSSIIDWREVPWIHQLAQSPRIIVARSLVYWKRRPKDSETAEPDLDCSAHAGLYVIDHFVASMSDHPAKVWKGTELDLENPDALAENLNVDPAKQKFWFKRVNLYVVVRAADNCKDSASHLSREIQLGSDKKFDLPFEMACPASPSQARCAHTIQHMTVLYDTKNPKSDTRLILNLAKRASNSLTIITDCKKSAISRLRFALEMHHSGGIPPRPDKSHPEWHTPLVSVMRDMLASFASAASSGGAETKRVKVA